MNCPACNKANRDKTKFCKWCGTAIVTSASNGTNDSSSSYGIDMLIEKDEIKSSLLDIIGKAKRMNERAKQFGSSGRMELSFVITGDSGTGKTTIANVIAHELYKAGICSTSEATIIAPTKYSDFIKELDKNISKIGNGVLIIEEAEKLVPDGQAIDLSQIDYVLKPIKEWRGDMQKPIVIFTGQQRLKQFFISNPNAASHINYFIETKEISVNGLVEITRKTLEEKYRLTLHPDSLDKLRRIYENDKRNPSDSKGANGHNADRRSYDIVLKCTNETDCIPPHVIEGKEFIPKTYGDIMNEFDKYVGVDEVKKCIHSIANSLEESRRWNGNQGIKMTDHFQFLGNPGTGKTTMARLFADALNAMGALPIGHLVEVSRKDLVSQYVGETAKLVEKFFDKAMGGILFIDEAYDLKNSENDSFGQEAINTILKLAEDRRGDIVVIIAGYTKEMGEFISSNSGLESRFNRTINFRDYTGEELAEIFRRMVRHSDEKYTLSDDADSHLNIFFNKMYNTRNVQKFGNAREVRNVYNRAVTSLKDRNAKLRNDGPLTPQQEREITLKDIEGENPSGTRNVDEILSSFDDMIGMDGVKAQIRTIANKVRIDRLRALKGGKVTQPNIHIVITGNPGTGKTVIAKRLGCIFKEIGVLDKGHVVERERKTLLDSYSNSAGANMDKAVDEAMGGILFIDEAYNLIPMTNPGSKDADGTAAVEALMTRMSNDAGKFITVIAGYKAEIEEFVANANPGLARRFTYRIHIDDYSVDNLVDIFKLNAKNEGFKLSAEAESLLVKKVEEMVTMKDKNFGNAGEMVKLFNQTKDRQSDRLSNIMDEEISDEMLNTFEQSDIPYNPPKKVNLADCMKELDDLVGLSSVKTAIRELADTLEIEQQRALASGERPQINLDHYLFLGNPGTGKTTVARIMGNIFYSLGLLPSNKVVEVTTKDLIAPYVGQTAPKTEQMINRSLGGIFFIDEAYGLNDGPNGFGKDAMPVLLTKLLDYKGKMVSIAAGYPIEMQEWINTNTGLESRYTRTIYFEDYTDTELAEIFRNIVSKNGLRMDEKADIEMQEYFSTLVFNKSENFANAREAKNYFDRVKLNQGRRLRGLVSTPGFDKDELFILTQEDMIIKY